MILLYIPLIAIAAISVLAHADMTNMPMVDTAKNMKPAIGSSTLDLKAYADVKPPRGYPKVGDGDGQFRIHCGVSHMANDDPIVYPGQVGAAHHHTFFGNTTTNANSNLSNLAAVGNSTCDGGIANRSAYWVPSMIDTATGTPLAPYFSLWYYKTGYRVVRGSIIAPPLGLRMIAGDMKSTKSQYSWPSNRFAFQCVTPTTHKSGDSIPACTAGSYIQTNISFPQCWDGKNLDSPDHKSHMSYARQNADRTKACDAAHPVAIPEIGLTIRYKVITDTSHWRLASDNYPVNGYNAGYSSHGDFVAGWNAAIINRIVTNCLHGGKDCGVSNLGDGFVLD